MSNDIHCIDFRKVDVTRKAALVFGDPPFNIGHKYSEFSDSMTEDDYLDFTHDWISKAWSAVAPGGVLAIHGSISLQPIYWPCLYEQSLEEFFVSQIVWSYGFGQCRFTNWVDSHCICMILRKPGRRKWNVADVLVKSARLEKYKDKRTQSSRYGGWRPPGTVWDFPRVTGNSRERRSEHPNQLPLKYIGRLVSAYVPDGELAIDCFSGSGTLSLACQSLGKDSVAFDISRQSVESARRRLSEQRELADEILLGGESYVGNIPQNQLSV